MKFNNWIALVFSLEQISSTASLFAKRILLMTLRLKGMLVMMMLCAFDIVSSSHFWFEPDGNSVRQDTGYGVSLDESACLVSDAASVEKTHPFLTVFLSKRVMKLNRTNVTSRT